VYPEGTITKDPGEWPMVGKTGAARIALATGRPVLPMAQWGATEVMRPYRQELRLLPRKTMHVSVGEPVDLSDFADRPMDHDTLEEATDRIMDALSAELAKIRGGEPPAHRFVPEHHGAHADPSPQGGH
jgi:1-acyl-sn-glycerol-3-phosphate acyltransferase